MQVITVNPAVIVQTLMDTRILVVPTHVLQEVTVLLVHISQHLAIREPSEERLEVQHRTIAVPAKKDMQQEETCQSIELEGGRHGSGCSG